MDRYGLNLSAARVLKVIDKLVYASQLRGVKDKRGVAYCYASKEWIAEKIGKSLRTVARAIHDLKAAGVIECKRTRSNALLYITGYEIYGTGSQQTDAGERVAGEAGYGFGTVENGQATSAPCHAPEKDTNGTSCEEASTPLFAMDGTSGTDTNGTSNIIPKSNNNQAHNQSINQSCQTERGKTDGKDCARMDSERAERERREQEAQEAVWINTHVELMRRLVWGRELDHLTQIGEFGAARLADFIADAVAGGRPIRVNGALLSPDQYWGCVRNLQNDALLKSTLQRVNGGRELKIVRNHRNYLLAAVYNCAMEQQFTDFTGASTRYWTQGDMYDDDNYDFCDILDNYGKGEKPVSKSSRGTILPAWWTSWRAYWAN